MIRAIVQLLFTVYTIMILVRVLGSYFPDFQHTQLMRFVAHYTDPYLNLFRRFIPPLGGTLDVSPMVAFFALYLARSIVTRIL